jgi:XFP-like protein
VLPVLHLNQYKIANPTLLARISDDELMNLLGGYGYAPDLVSGDDPAFVHQALAAALETCVKRIAEIHHRARAAGILRGTSRSGRSSPPSRSPQYRTGMHPHRGAPRLIGASSACPPRAVGIWWNPVFWVGVHGGSHRGESQP